ncbi:dicarboxylate/amino acid:cation symporter [Pseudohongiella sp. SYSU M77423]|uniref:dicarboxylate/amino acid:cation symporter n=1 Tax=unclassified Pseudohongiella TaxID=2629611 RepID=UPI001F1FC4EB|nr:MULTISPECIES: dicarboxylate/amino acid:cation symporter [unclassified Pseudohongiella]MDH7942249.1 dicarboxylate/amino acid:cation symporter [Pseudohongiella sp. SYSU M77423]MEC8859435.1 dicarboxylate/amino acid:cation symporter [Pseudomonadota bacterium]
MTGTTSKLQFWFDIPLWKRIILALVLGVVVGAIWGEGAQSIRWIGDVFIRLIQMVVVPLVFITIVAGIVSMGDPQKLGSLGVKTLAVYMLTTLFAISIGLVLAAIVQPGVGVDLSGAEPGALQDPIPLGERLMTIIPSNPIAALAEGNILAVIFFALLFGIGILTVGKPAETLAHVMDAGSAVMLKLTHWVMEVAPFGVFALIAWVAGTQGVAALLQVVGLALTVTVACVLQLVVVHGGLMKFVLKLNPLDFFRGAKNAMLVAFSTSSSSATLPVTMSVAETNLGIRPVVASTTLPIGATINMDGSALYVGIVSVFAAQAFGVSLDLMDYMLIAATTTLVSIGTAAVPGASIFLMAAVMETIGLSPAQIALVVGFVLPFDRPLDMMRTAVNVTGDLSVATAVARWSNEFDEDIFTRKNPVSPEKIKK